MKKLFLFIAPIVMLICLALIGFGIFQVRLTREKALDDLRRRTKHIAESMDLSVKYILTHNDTKAAEYMVEKFGKRDRPQGCIIYDEQGRIFTLTSRFIDLKKNAHDYVKDVIESKQPRAGIEDFEGHRLYSYVLPVYDDDGKALGAVEILHDTAYIFARLSELWRYISITLIVLVLMVVLVSFPIQRMVFVLPVKRLTEWFEHFQKGDTDAYHPIKDKDELGRLASEVEQVALQLRVARRTISQEAKERLEKEEIWTERKLHDLVQAKVGENALFVVSNREPYMHITDSVTGKASCMRPASGVVTAIDPILKACGGMWLAHGAGDADRRFVNSRDKLGVPSEDNRYILKRVWLSKDEEQGYYYGFSNEGLWPLCHATHTRPSFKEEDWNMYKRVNEKFAAALLSELPAKNAFVFIQDYHFTLLPKLIKDKRPDVMVALFWHIPWPTAEIFSICPYQKDILEGMLGCDLLGFHVQSHCNNFLDTANKLLESRVDTARFSVILNSKETFVKPFPISIDFADSVKNVSGQVAAIKEEYALNGKIIGVGVDRIDYTKGIAERFTAIERFLDKNPQYKEKISFVQIGAPSRTHIKKYHDLISEIDALVDQINWKYSTPDWKPIVYIKRHLSPEEILPYYVMADFCIVSSLDDGMNLVAKEYIRAKEDSRGVLLLSRFTGAARELDEAVKINPYAIEDFAQSIRMAIEMPDEEKQRRMTVLRKMVERNNIYLWAAQIIDNMVALKKV